MTNIKIERFVVIFALLIVALVAIAECKRGGGGGRIFRATVLKERRNSRRPRDLHAQQVIEPVSNTLLDEMFETTEGNNYDEIETVPSGEPMLSLVNHKNTPYTRQESLHKNGNLGNSDSEDKDDNTDAKSEDYSVEDEIENSQQFEVKSNAERNKDDYQESVKEGNSETTEYQNKKNLDDILFGSLSRRNADRISNSVSSSNYDKIKNHRKLVMSVLNVVLGLSRRSRYNNDPENKSKKVLKPIILPIDSIVSCKKNEMYFCPLITKPVCTSSGQILCGIYKTQSKQCERNYEVVIKEDNVEDKDSICVVTLAIVRFDGEPDEE